MKKSADYGLLFFWLVFISMCVFKLWFTLLWVVLFAVGLTFLKKKRSYCHNVCPVGYIQDEVYSSGEPEKRKLPHTAILRKIIFVVFWGYIVLYIFLLYDQTVLLWVKMLQLMVFSLFTALLLQYFFRKRLWCSSLCPVGSILNKVMRLRV